MVIKNVNTNFNFKNEPNNLLSWIRSYNILKDKSLNLFLKFSFILFYFMFKVQLGGVGCFRDQGGCEEILMTAFRREGAEDRHVIWKRRSRGRRWVGINSVAF